MLLHLGKNSVIPLKDIIAIIDKESAFKSDDTIEFFKKAEKNGLMDKIVDLDVKTYVLTDRTERDTSHGRKKRKSVIYTSNISSATLKKRAGFVDNMINI